MVDEVMAIYAPKRDTGRVRKRESMVSSIWYIAQQQETAESTLACSNKRGIRERLDVNSGEEHRPSVSFLHCVPSVKLSTVLGLHFGCLQ